MEKERFSFLPVRSIFIYTSTFILFFNFSFRDLKAATPVVLKDEIREHQLIGEYLDLLEDTSATLTLEDILSEKYQRDFRINHEHIPFNKNPSSAYWIKFILRNESAISKKWVIEVFDFSIDYVDIFIPEGGEYVHFKGGAAYPFSMKEYFHKNFIFDLPLQRGEDLECYIRIYSQNQVGFISAIRTNQKLTSYSVTEYLLLALFYGLLIAMACYNLFLFFSICDLAYLYYVLYVLFAGIYFLTQDGLGFQYLWPDLPELNNRLYMVSLCLMVVFAFLYARSFLHTREFMPSWDKVILLLIGLRVILFITAWYFYPPIAGMTWIDVILLACLFLAGIIAWLKGYRPARFYLLAYTLLFTGFSIAGLKSIGIISSSILTVYSFNIGAGLEMIFLSFALADRIKVLVSERDKVRQQYIAELQNKEELQDKLNKELEDKVRERTKELSDKNKQLDIFVYKASHDIKGPLRSVIGLTKLGTKEIKDSLARQYFEEIHKCTSRLDNILTDLLTMSKVKEVQVNKQPLSFKLLISDVLNSFRHFPGYESVKFNVQVEEPHLFYSDEKMIYSILQNLTENAIKYRDSAKEQPQVNISIRVKEKEAEVIFEDNGLGIEENYREKVFDMFFKAEANSPGTGLGLHIVRMSVEKLGGKILLEGQRGKGTKFTLTIPY